MSCEHEFVVSRLYAELKSVQDEAVGDPPTGLLRLEVCKWCGVLRVSDKSRPGVIR